MARIKFMHIPKQYIRDKRILFLLGFNAALFVLAAAYVVFSVDPGLNKVSIVEYRSNWVTQGSGSTSDLYEFALFALLISVISVLLSIKYYDQRRYTALSALCLNAVCLIFCIVVFNALVGVKS